MSVIDLGGTADFWASAPKRPARLTVINPAAGPDSRLSWAEVITGDACDPPASLNGQTFDLVYSNSTIESSLSQGGNFEGVRARQISPRSRGATV
jgi:hypothetical protein